MSRSVCRSFCIRIGRRTRRTRGHRTGTSISATYPATTVSSSVGLPDFRMCPPWRSTSIPLAAGLTSAQIRSVPVFNPYPASITNTPSMSLLVRAAHLTQGIPALAPPTGGCSVRAVFSGSRSFNLNLDADEDEESDENGVSKPHGWPTRSTYPGRWLHSDMKDVAFYYTYKFYAAGGKFLDTRGGGRFMV